MEEAREVFAEATARILEAISFRRVGEAVKWLTDLIYYASLKGYEKQYVELFRAVLREIEGEPIAFKRKFAHSLNTALDKIIRGSEAVYVGELVSVVEKVKNDALAPYYAPLPELKRRASRIVDEVFK